jgi:5-(carboxyamino)imidazole ribonucleotide mutase
VATVALDSAGARNAAWLAAQILATNDPDLAQRLREARQTMAEQVETDAAALI